MKKHRKNNILQTEDMSYENKTTFCDDILTLFQSHSQRQSQSLILILESKYPHKMQFCF